MSSSQRSPTHVLPSAVQSNKANKSVVGAVSSDTTVTTSAVVPDNSGRVPQTTAFTVHFDNDKFTKRHVRNLSLPISKIYGNKMDWDANRKSPVANGNTSEPVANAVSGSDAVNAGLGSLRLTAAGNHSEGYFSSDAEDDPLHQKLFVAKLHNSVRKGSKLTNLAQEKRTAEKQHLGATPVLLDDEDDVVIGTRSDQAMKKEDRDKEEDGSDLSDAASEISETGTYTIDREQDRENVEVVTARLNIDNTFGINQHTTVGTIASEDPSNCDSAHSSLSWVNDWASHVVEHNSLAGVNHVTGPTGLPQQKRTTAVSPTPGIRGVTVSKIPSPLSSVRTLTRSNNANMPLPVTASDRSNVSVVANKESPRARRSITQPITVNSASKQPQSQLHQEEYSDSSLETESYLLATERVVTALQARVSLSMDSGGESDPDNGYSHSSGKQRRSGNNALTPSSSATYTKPVVIAIQSDSSASESGGTSGAGVSRRTTPTTPKQCNATTPTATTRYNRAFSLRRGRLDEPNKKDGIKTSSSSTSLASPADKKIKNRIEVSGKTSNNSPTQFASRASRAIPASPQQRTGLTASHTGNATPHRSQSFTRTDCGRYSMRGVKATPLGQAPGQNKGEIVKKKLSGGRSNSTLSSREVEFQNWKRRKSYDPMKAAAEGKKKEAAKKQLKVSSVSGTSQTSSSNPVLRSASFHGTRQLAIPSSSDEDDDNDEAEEEEEEEEEEAEVEDEVVASNEEFEEEEQDWVTPAAPKTSLESTPRGSRVSLYSSASNSSLRSRPKLEGVDNLVISALSGLSGKVKIGSCNLLKKLRYLYDEDSPKAHQLTAEIEQLEVSEPGSPHHSVAANTNANNTRSPSRELSSTLRNLKRIESVVKVLDNVLFDNEDFH